MKPLDLLGTQESSPDLKLSIPRLSINQKQPAKRKAVLSLQ